MRHAFFYTLLALWNGQALSAEQPDRFDSDAMPSRYATGLNGAVDDPCIAQSPITRSIFSQFKE